MKFAKQLALRIVPNWQGHYVSYRDLKGFIKRFASTGQLEGVLETSESGAIPVEELLSSWPDLVQVIHDTYLTKEVISNTPFLQGLRIGATSPSEPASEQSHFSAVLGSLETIPEWHFALLFCERIRLELEKVNAWYEQCEREGSRDLEMLDQRWHANMTANEKAQWRDDMTRLLQMLESLADYSQTNISGFRKVLKKYDKQMNRWASGDFNLDDGVVDQEPPAPLAHLYVDRAQQFHQHQDPMTPLFEHAGMTLGSPMDLAPSTLDSEKPNNNFRVPPTPLPDVTSMVLNRKPVMLSGLLWNRVTALRFVKSERDELLLAQAKLLWRKRVPAVVASVLSSPIQSPSMPTPTVMDLDLETLPWGAVSRMWVVLAHDGLANPISVPVIVAKGAKTGPILGITAALHGNELNGIPLIHRLFRELSCSELHGIVVAVPVANTPGYLRQQRGFSDGNDLNRMMPGKKDGTTAQIFAYNLMTRIVAKLDHLIDLHTASKGRVNSLYVRADMTDPRTRRMARLQNPQIIVHNTSPDGSLRGAAMERGISSITVEIGDPSRVQKRFVRHALLGVSNIMCSLKMIPHEPDLPDFEPIVCARSYWIFASAGGMLTVLPDVNTWVKRGEPVAYLYSIFGDLILTYFAPEDGIVIGKSIDPVCQTGSRILHLGVADNAYPTGAANDGHL